jgi:hypothetical protein
MKKIARMCLLLLAILTTNLAAIATANEITDWNRTLLMLANLDGTKPLVLTRAIAIVQSAVFDAVNGIEPRYTAVHVQPAAPAGGSRRAAAVQAAYATMVKLFPTQQFTLDLRRTISSRYSRVTLGRQVHPLQAESTGARRWLTRSWRGRAPTDLIRCCLPSWAERLLEYGAPPRLISSPASSSSLQP